MISRVHRLRSALDHRGDVTKGVRRLGCSQRLPRDLERITCSKSLEHGLAEDRGLFRARYAVRRAVDPADRSFTKSAAAVRGTRLPDHHDRMRGRGVRRIRLLARHPKEESMKVLILVAAIVGLAITPVAAGSAKKFAPGQRQRRPGQAKQFAPGQQAR